MPDRRAHHRYILHKALHMEFLGALRLLLPHFSRGGRIEVVTVARALLPADWMIRAVVSVSAAPLGKVLARDALLVRVLFRHSSLPVVEHGSFSLESRASCAVIEIDWMEFCLSICAYLISFYSVSMPLSLYTLPAKTHPYHSKHTFI